MHERITVSDRYRDECLTAWWKTLCTCGFEHDEPNQLYSFASAIEMAGLHAVTYHSENGVMLEFELSEDRTGMAGPGRIPPELSGE